MLRKVFFGKTIVIRDMTKTVDTELAEVHLDHLDMFLDYHVRVYMVEYIYADCHGFITWCRFPEDHLKLPKRVPGAVFCIRAMDKERRLLGEMVFKIKR